MRALLLAALAIAVPRTAAADDVTVTTTAELVAALAAAQPGDVITLAPGTYATSANLRCDRAGEPGRPITVRAAALGTVVIESSAVEGFHVTAPHWRFEGLEMRGTCADDDACEHAFHVVGLADGTAIVGNRLVDFNAQIKGNGAPVGPGGAFTWPDDVVIAGNELFDTRPRMTANPVTKIDVVGGRRWRVVANYLHDFAKGGGDNVSYAAFLKGNSRDGVLERNLVVCERLHRGQVRLGLSLGGGGTGPDSICEDGTCSPEHQGGTIRNNLVAHCPADVGIYLNEAAGTRVLHNTLYDTTGIDVRFAASTAEVRGNLVSGAVRDRDGGSSVRADNVLAAGNAAFAAWFRDPDALDFTLTDGAMLVDRGAALADVTDDYCARPRTGLPDLGALEYDVASPCDTRVTHPGPPPGPGVDGGLGPDGGDGTTDPDGGCCGTGGGATSPLLALALLAWLRARRPAR